MYVWLKYVAFALIALFIGSFVFDVFRHARMNGGTWKNVLVRIIMWLVLFILVVSLNVWLNRNWIPGRVQFMITPFGG